MLPPKPARLSYVAEPASPGSPKLNKAPVLPPRSYNDASSPTPPNVPPPVRQIRRWLVVFISVLCSVQTVIITKFKLTLAINMI